MDAVEREPPLSFAVAVEGDADELAALHARAGEELTRLYGQGHWSLYEKVKGVLRGITTARTVCAHQSGQIVGTYRLATKKPWAIDLTYFTPVRKVVYLQSMAVLPSVQRQGVGRALIGHAVRYAVENGIDAIRLDAYDAPAGAGGFYAKCGFRARGGKVYRNVPLLYFEWLTG